MSNFIDKIIDFIKEFWMSSLFIVGIGMYCAGMTEWGLLEGHKHWSEITKKCGEIVAISGVTSFFLSITQYNRIYQKALEDIIYSKTFLAKRSDLNEMWNNVSVALFESKFPEIHKPLFNIITEKYFPSGDNVSYYTDIKQHLYIDWKVDEENTIVIKEKIDLIVHTVNNDKTDYKSRFIVILDGTPTEEQWKHIIDVKELFVDGNPCLDKATPKWKPSEGRLTFESCAPLSGGKKEYHIVQSVIRTQNLNIDDFLNYSARYLISNMDVEVEHPDNLKVALYEGGTMEKFIPMYERNNHKRWTYTGLILRKQGYVMTFNKTISCDGSGLIVPTAAETNVPPTVAT